MISSSQLPKKEGAVVLRMIVEEKPLPAILIPIAISPDHLEEPAFSAAIGCGS